MRNYALSLALLVLLPMNGFAYTYTFSDSSHKTYECQSKRGSDSFKLRTVWTRFETTHSLGWLNEFPSRHEIYVQKSGETAESVLNGREEVPTKLESDQAFLDVSAYSVDPQNHVDSSGASLDTRFGLPFDRARELSPNLVAVFPGTFVRLQAELLEKVESGENGKAAKTHLVVYVSLPDVRTMNPARAEFEADAFMAAVRTSGNDGKHEEQELTADRYDCSYVIGSTGE